MDKVDFLIIGGGVAGLTAAISLHKIGIDATVYEQASKLTGIGAGFGFAANAMKAFDILGMKEGIVQLGHYLDSYEILDDHGNVLASPNTQAISSKYNEDNFAIHRGELHQHLLAQISPSKIYLGKSAVRLEQENSIIRVYFSDETVVECAALLIADGVKSTLRQQLVPSSKPRYSGYTCWRGVIDNSSINLKTGSETWGKGGRFGMTPLVGNKIYWYACINSLPNNSTYANFTEADLSKHFASYHFPIPQIISETKDEELIWNDIIDIKPLKHLAYGRILLIGDAGHATTPNLGQGACQAIEDVAVLIDELKKKQSVEKAFGAFENRRLERTAYITKTSWQIGKISQWENSFFVYARNTFMRLLPESVKQKTLQQLLEVNFMEINRNHGK